MQICVTNEFSPHFLGGCDINLDYLLCILKSFCNSDIQTTSWMIWND